MTAFFPAAMLKVALHVTPIEERRGGCRALRFIMEQHTVHDFEKPLAGRCSMSALDGDRHTINIITSHKELVAAFCAAARRRQGRSSSLRAGWTVRRVPVWAGPFPQGLPPRPSWEFSTNGLCDDLPGGGVDRVPMYKAMAATTADHKGLAAAFSHDLCP